jgi:hypothetical protein
MPWESHGRHMTWWRVESMTWGSECEKKTYCWHRDD